MATKPTPGGSDGTYGTELNAFLDVSLASDGKVKTEALQTDATAPSADAALANKKYVDDEITTAVAGAGFWKTDGSTVFNTSLTSALTFQDLDLSAKIGSNAALVFLEIKAGAAGAFAIKTKGFGGTLVQHTSAAANAYGGSQFHPEAANEHCYMTIAADSSGIIQIGCVNNTTTFTIKLIGYVK